ncbi:hypothetical protein [Allorhizocola rhizosphaerae]|uniref:hypothetical protein n=1 Tax=Allorhizocola rhizosphaerae TaxID=1872709 RepID=UPI000E3C83C1|nr:hypothetical protein [Allorhizocola rhizosphaerae]
MPEHYAALVRPIIDRVYTSVRRAARPRTIDVVERMGLQPGFISSFYFGLLARPMPAASFAAATTYSGSDMTEELEQGIAWLDADGTWHITESGRALGLALQLAIAEGAQEFWADRASTLPRLAELLGRLLEAGAATGGPAFAALAPAYEPDGASPALLVTSRLGALRHHRADAHRAAWQSAGLSLPGLLALPADSPARVAIEGDTNRRDAPVYGCLTADERTEFMGLLGALPG